MGLFKPDLYKSFAVGFALGAALIAVQVVPGMSDGLVSQAHAAPAPVAAR